MKQFSIIIAVLIGAGFVSSCDDPKEYVGPDGKESGEIIYQKTCFLCHGEYGDEGNSGAANLRTSLLDEDDMIDAVKHGRGEMRPISQLNDTQVKLVIEYVRTELKKKVKE